MGAWEEFPEVKVPLAEEPPEEEEYMDDIRSVKLAGAMQTGELLAGAGPPNFARSSGSPLMARNQGLA